MDVTNEKGYISLPARWNQRFHIVRIFDGAPAIGNVSRLRRAVNRVLDERAVEFQVEWRELKTQDARVVDVVMDQVMHHGGWPNDNFLPGDSFLVLSYFSTKKNLLNDICISLGLGEKDDNPVKNQLVHGDELPRWWFLPSSVFDGTLGHLVESIIEHKSRAGIVVDDKTICHECRKTCQPNQLIAFGTLQICADCKPLVVQRIKEGVD